MATNVFNCPIVSSYTDVIDSSLDLGTRNEIPLDKPVITFRDTVLLTRACDKGFDSLQALTQWAYPNRLYHAETFLHSFHKRINQRFSLFRFYTPFHDIRTIADKAGRRFSI